MVALIMQSILPQIHPLFKLLNHFRSDSDVDVFIGLFQNERLVSTQSWLDHHDFRQVDNMCPGNLYELCWIQLSRELGQRQGRGSVDPVPAEHFTIAQIILHVADVLSVDDDSRIYPVQLQSGTEGVISRKQTGCNAPGIVDMGCGQPFLIPPERIFKVLSTVKDSSATRQRPA